MTIADALSAELIRIQRESEAREQRIAERLKQIKRLTGKLRDLND